MHSNYIQCTFVYQYIKWEVGQCILYVQQLL